MALIRKQFIDLIHYTATRYSLGFQSQLFIPKHDVNDVFMLRAPIDKSLLDSIKDVTVSVSEATGELVIVGKRGLNEKPK